MIRPIAIAALAAVALVFAACGSPRESQLKPTPQCVSCHGGSDNLTGAPPIDTHARIDDTLPSVGAHSSHVQASALSAAIPCTECHPDPRFGSAVHANGTANVAFGALASKGTSPAWNPDANTCSSTYCHGATLGGGTHKTPDWTQVGQGEATCGTCHGVPPPLPHPAVSSDLAGCHACHPQTVDVNGSVIPASQGGKHLDGAIEGTGHDTSWMDTSSPGFHAYSANAGLGTCQGCHGALLDGGSAGVACASCHNPAGPGNDFSTCTACHGGTDNQTGAPPRPIWGAASPVAVGAHTPHVAGSALARPFDCALCHVKPTDMLSAGHVDGAVTVTGYTGTDPALLATVKDPGWSASGATCAAAYCHGATLGGGSNTMPVWTQVGTGQAACGTCHGLPPPAPHPLGYNCGGCHDGYTSGNVNLALHVNGAIDVGTPSCTSCHGNAAVAPTPANPQLAAAPPLGTHGEAQTTQPAVGAHQVHVNDGPLSLAVACTECHVVPTSFAHASGAPVVPSFGPKATANGTLTPTWNGAATTCASTYCHGATIPGGAQTAPNWTLVDGSQIRCTSCHGNPPSSGRHFVHALPPGSSDCPPGKTCEGFDCNGCHPGNYSGGLSGGTPQVTPDYHVNGQLDLAAFVRVASGNYTCGGCHPPGNRTW